MKRAGALFVAFLLGALMAVLGAVVLKPVQAGPVPTSAPTSTAAPTSTTAPTSTAAPTSTPTAIPSLTPTQENAPAQIEGAGGKEIGWTGQIQCLNCTPFTVRVQLNHYNPTAYDPMYPQLNCWDYSEPYKYCLSPVWIGVPWETGWGLFAACPNTWAVGSWLEVPDAPLTTICMDQGGDVICDDTGLCQVDILGPGGAAWDGKVFDATLWVPRSWLIRFAESQKEEE